jgi:hypothetical protein
MGACFTVFTPSAGGFITVSFVPVSPACAAVATASDIATAITFTIVFMLTPNCVLQLLNQQLITE